MMDAEKLKWTREIVLKLIKARGEDCKHLFKGKSFNNQAAWKSVKECLGTDHDVKAISKKWSNLTQKNKTLKDPPSGVSKENGEETASSWPFYAEMDEVLRMQHTISPPTLVLSSANILRSSASTPTLTPPPKSGSSGSRRKRSLCQQNINIKKNALEQNNKMLRLLNNFVICTGGEGLGSKVEVPINISLNDSD